MRRRLIVVALAVAAAAAAAGCGEDDEQVSAEELISRGDRICAEGRKSFGEIQARSPTSAAAAAAQTGKLVRLATGQLNELRSISPPDELRESYDSYLEARARALALLERGRDAAERKDADAYSKVQARAAAELRKRLKLARAVGFKTCSKG